MIALYPCGLTLTFLLGALHVLLIVHWAHGTDVSIGAQLVSRKILLQGKNSTGRRWDLNPDLCRYHGNCCKNAKQLCRLDLVGFDALINYIEYKNFIQL